MAVILPATSGTTSTNSSTIRHTTAITVTKVLMIRAAFFPLEEFLERRLKGFARCFSSITTAGFSR